MFRWGLLLLLILSASVASVSAAGVSQRVWMEQLTDSLGWGYGLPDEPVTEDYIELLSGKRNVFVEVEEKHRRSDRVAVKHLTNFGFYSGTGWVAGRREPVQIHLDILIPHDGDYQLSAMTRLPGVKFQLSGQEFFASADNRLTSQVLGQVSLAAGQTEVVITLPPNAGVDSFQLRAPPLPAISPRQGWQPERQLETADMALTLLQALDLLSTLPASGQNHRFEAETSALPKSVHLTDSRHLGVPSGDAWVRTGYLPTAWQMFLPLVESGCYQLVLRGTSAEPVKVRLAGYLDEQVSFSHALDNYSLGRYCLPQGFALLELDLPPRAGIDSLEMQTLDTSVETLRRLIGLLDGPAEIQVQTADEVLQLLTSLTR